jgi:S1-C subfamily serine protease
VARTCRWITAVAVGLGWWLPAPAEELRDLYKRVNPAVVEVLTTETGATSPNAIGSGFLISPDGLVITAAHVVQTADRVTVRFLSGETVPAVPLAADPRADVALLKAQGVPAGTPVLPLGDSDRVEIGDQVAAGSPAAGLGLRAGSLRARVGDEELLLGGDVILSVMGVPVGQPDSPQRIRSAVASAGGGPITVEVLRAGTVVSLSGLVSRPGASR